MKARELLCDESKWCKGSYALNKNDQPVDPTSPAATRWCLAGSVEKAYEYKGNATDKLYRAVFDKYDRTVVKFNDDPSTTYAQVKALLDELDI